LGTAPSESHPMPGWARAGVETDTDAAVAYAPNAEDGGAVTGGEEKRERISCLTSLRGKDSAVVLVEPVGAEWKSRVNSSFADCTGGAAGDEAVTPVPGIGVTCPTDGRPLIAGERSCRACCCAYVKDAVADD
jgi:hypothetical protein